MTDALSLLNPPKRYCACGCGKLLVKKPGETNPEFERRKYTGYKCAAKGRIGTKVHTYTNYVPPTPHDNKTIHPVIDKFLSRRA